MIAASSKIPKRATKVGDVRQRTRFHQRVKPIQTVTATRSNSAVAKYTPATATWLPTFRMTEYAADVTLSSALRTKLGRFSFDGVTEIAAVALIARQGGSHAR